MSFLDASLVLPSPLSLRSRSGLADEMTFFPCFLGAATSSKQPSRQATVINPPSLDPSQLVSKSSRSSTARSSSLSPPNENASLERSTSSEKLEKPTSRNPQLSTLGTRNYRIFRLPCSDRSRPPRTRSRELSDKAAALRRPLRTITATTDARSEDPTTDMLPQLPPRSLITTTLPDPLPSPPSQPQQPSTRSPKKSPSTSRSSNPKPWNQHLRFGSSSGTSLRKVPNRRARLPPPTRLRGLRAREESSLRVRFLGW